MKKSATSHSDFLYTDEADPHIARRQQILQKYPQVKELFGNNPWSAFFIIALVGTQVAVAWLFRDSSWWVVLLGAYLFGAVVCHGLWALIHDCTHNLVFRSTFANCSFQVLANLPHIFPSAISFRKYHMLHHRYQGRLDFDADLASPMEVRFAGNSSFGKAFWLLFYFLFQSVRVTRLKKIPLVSPWIIANIVVEALFIFAIVYWLGWVSFFYLLLSSVFAIGLHPVGARWIQEHFLVKPPQETYSYYGVMNWTAFNVGYHNEHHDFMAVPWSRLPQVKATAPEFYETLHFHRSWTKLLLKFIFDPSLSLRSRRVRRA